MKLWKKCSIGLFVTGLVWFSPLASFAVEQPTPVPASNKEAVATPAVTGEEDYIDDPVPLLREAATALKVSNPKLSGRLEQYAKQVEEETQQEDAGLDEENADVS